jgi:hypothetical protein
MISPQAYAAARAEAYDFAALGSQSSIAQAGAVMTEAELGDNSNTGKKPAPDQRRDDPPAARSQRAVGPDRWPWLFLALGSVLRVAWPLDMEWKYDEKWMFQTAVRVANGQEPWSWVGMPSGVQLRNPGLSFWPFALLGHVTQDPVAMTQVVQWCNVLGVWILAAWVMRTWSAADRALGLWSLALYAVSPLTVLFSRKLWAQDLLILLVVPWLWAHRKRATKLGGFGWGFFGAVLGQLHMSGFFAAAALCVVTLWRDRRRFPLLPWLVGSLCGAWPLIPWLLEVARPGTHGATLAHSHRSLAFFAHGVRHAFGLGLEYPLGRHYKTFLRGPEWFGMLTHLNKLARYGLFALLGLGVALRVRALRSPGQGQASVPEPVGTYLATVLLTGVLLLAAGVAVYAHYLIVLGPLLHLGAAWLLYPRRTALFSACALQAFLSVSFACFIHAHAGAPNADYGMTYRAQSEVQRRELNP